MKLGGRRLGGATLALAVAFSGIALVGAAQAVVSRQGCAVPPSPSASATPTATPSPTSPPSSPTPGGCPLPPTQSATPSRTPTAHPDCVTGTPPQFTACPTQTTTVSPSPSPSRTVTVTPSPTSSTHPPTASPTPTQTTPSGKCSDGLDNDGDGAIDGSDGGCKSASDDDERNVIKVGTRTTASHQASPHRFRGVLKAARKVCVTGRKVRVEEFNGFGFAGSDRTDRRGRWSIPHTQTDPSWTYLVAVDEKTIKTSKLIIICKGRVRGVKSPD